MSKKWSTAQGDCLEVLRRLGDNCLDSCVTDPPYGLSFLGKKWDYDVPSVEIWKEVYRVLKPGGYLLAFAGTRTQHRMAVNIEDAGFEIRDMIAWMYGQGFPKSLDVSKAIDKSAGAEREVVGTRTSVYGTETATGERASRPGGGAGLFVGTDPKVVPLVSDEAVTDEAKQWQGWGTALKPAMEPITVARKPLEGTVAANVLKYGTGAINIDGCRISVSKDDDIHAKNPHTKGGFGHAGAEVYGKSDGADAYDPSKGRFPANVIMDEEAGKILDEQSGVSTSAGGRTANISKTSKIYGGGKRLGQDIDAEAVKGDPGFGDTGGASRFFYCPKTNKKDRNEGLDGTELVITIEACDQNITLVGAKVTLLVGTEQLPPKAIGESGALNKNVREWSMFLFGNNIMDQSQTENKSIIKTKTSSTTTLKILNLLNLSFTKDTTAAANLLMAFGINLAESAKASDQFQIITNEKMESALGVNHAASGTRLTINVRDFLNRHETVKPTDLMRYLCRLVTPPEGIILDPFMGSGSTGKAAILEGFKFIGIEREAQYIEIAQKRLAEAEAT